MMALTLMSALDTILEGNLQVSFALLADDVHLFVSHRSMVFCAVFAAKALNNTIDTIQDK